MPPPIPPPLRDTIARTHAQKTAANNNLAWQLGFVGTHRQMTLDELLTRLETSGHLRILREIHGRAARFAGLWDHIHEILNLWDYAAGAGVSQGFKFTCRAPEQLRSFMRSRTTFCEDDPRTAVHGDKDCFRELIQSGPGLHMCVTRPSSYATEDHDLHIDAWQVVCDRKTDGQCDYHYRNVQFFQHLRHAAPWAIGNAAGNASRRVGQALDEVGRVLATTPIERGPRW